MNAERDGDADERRPHVQQIARLAVDVPEDEDRHGDGNRRQRGRRPACCAGGPGGAPWGPIRRRDGRPVDFRACRRLRAPTAEPPTAPAASRRCPARPATSRSRSGATMCTAPTPAASGANASSSLGIMPPCTVPSAIAACASATVSRGRRVAGSSLSRRTPPTPVQATSAPAPQRRRELVGDDVGVDVQDGAARRRRRGRRSPGAQSRASQRVEQRAGRSRRRRRPGRSRSARRPRPRRRAAAGGARGSRRSRPTARTAGTPAAAQRRAQIDVELARRRPSS